MSSQNNRGHSFKRLSEQQRLEIIHKLKSPTPPSKRSLAREYHVDEKAIRRIWENRDKIEQRALSMSIEKRATTFRASLGHFSPVEDRLYLWMDAMRRLQLPVSPSLAIVKAKQIAAELSISENDFKASWRWFDRFRKRKGLLLQNTLLHGEGAQVLQLDKNDPELLAQLEKLYNVISEYDPEHVYNMDKTGFFYRQLPRYDVLMPQEDVSTVQGKKRIKDRVSFVVCANATGSHKISCALIGKAKSPACSSKNHMWPLPYFYQKNAWMDQETCWKWFREVFLVQVRQRTAHRILLLMDDAPGHLGALEQDNVRVEVFPSSCASWKQPCNQGIIAAFKKRVKYLYLADVLEYHGLNEVQKQQKQDQVGRLPRGAAGASYGKPAHLLDAANYITNAWATISSATIRNAFDKAGIMKTTIGQNEEGNDNVDDLEMIQNRLLQDMANMNINVTDDEMNAFLDADNENSLEYAEAVMEDVNDLLNHQDGEDENTHDDILSEVKSPEEVQMITNGQITFLGLDNLYNKVLSIEDQLLCKEFEKEAGEQFGILLSSFSSFQKQLQSLIIDAKQRQCNLQG